MFATRSIIATRLSAFRAASTTGVVKFFNPEKGFGFITRDDGQGDVFVHFTGIKMDGFRELHQGQTVKFETFIDPQSNKPKAVNVTVNDASQADD
jgi:CspA family cold shock protein